MPHPFRRMLEALRYRIDRRDRGGISSLSDVQKGDGRVSSHREDQCVLRESRNRFDLEREISSFDHTLITEGHSRKGNSNTLNLQYKSVHSI